METVLLIKEGKKEFVDIPSPGTDEQLEELYRLLECETLEAVSLADDLAIWVDGEGLFKEDQTLQAIAYVSNNQVVYADQLAGAILVTSSDAEGELVGFPEERLAEIERDFRLVDM